MDQSDLGITSGASAPWRRAKERGANAAKRWRGARRGVSRRERSSEPTQIFRPTNRTQARRGTRRASSGLVPPERDLTGERERAARDTSPRPSAPALLTPRVLAGAAGNPSRKSAERMRPG